MFSYVSPGSRPSNDGANMSMYALNAGSIEMVRKSMSSASASSCASDFEWSDEYRDGIDTPCTCSAPSASTAIAAMIDESIPPDSPITTSLKPFFRQ